MLGLREIEAREIETRERQERLDISSAWSISETQKRE
jgi:hypothetical protein